MSKDMSILEIVKDLFPYNYSVVGDESIDATEKYLKHLSFNINRYKSGSFGPNLGELRRLRGPERTHTKEEAT